MAIKEIYQIQPLRDNSIESLNRLIEEINMRLFTISQRLASLSIPQSDVDSSTSLEDLITALTAAGIVED